MSAVPSAFTLVLVEVEDLLMLAGVVVVAVPLVEVLDLVVPIGLLMVLDFDVTFVPGWVVLLVVMVDALLLIVVAGAAGVVAGAWASATELPSRLSEKRKPKMRFIKRKNNE